ncbi:hypothetical protein C8R43DRAFT_955075 [Mycena crocata]|nr:hypothetical protein C8R43DRAFT_955075 [Mycena crocata]
MRRNPGEDGINSSWREQRARGAEEIGGQCNPCCCVTIRGACHFDNVKIQHGTVSPQALSTALEPVHRRVTLGSRRVYGFDHSSTTTEWRHHRRAGHWRRVITQAELQAWCSSIGGALRAARFLVAFLAFPPLFRWRYAPPRKKKVNLFGSASGVNSLSLNLTTSVPRHSNFIQFFECPRASSTFVTGLVYVGGATRRPRNFIQFWRSRQWEIRPPSSLAAARSAALKILYTRFGLCRVRPSVPANLIVKGYALQLYTLTASPFNISEVNLATSPQCGPANFDLGFRVPATRVQCPCPRPDPQPKFDFWRSRERGYALKYALPRAAIITRFFPLNLAPPTRLLRNSNHPTWRKTNP